MKQERHQDLLIGGRITAYNYGQTAMVVQLLQIITQLIIVQTIATQRKFIILNASALVPQLLGILSFSRFNGRNNVGTRGMLPVACLVNLVVSTGLVFFLVFIGFKKRLFKESNLFYLILAANALMLVFWGISFFVFEEYSVRFKNCRDMIMKAQE